jgi:isoleucyl-tRNA synthetase
MRKIDPYLPESVFLSSWPDTSENNAMVLLEKKWEQILALRGGVSRALESARTEGIIGHSLDAEVEVLSNDMNRDILSLLQKEEWATLAIVSSFDVVDSFKEDGFDWKDEETETKFRIRKAPGEKCPRCWKRSTEVSMGSVCLRCNAVLEG